MSLFGSSSPFGASNSSPFGGGSSSTANPFGSTTPSSPFGTNQNTSSMFGAKTFGSPSFGASQTGSSIFGGTATGAFGASTPAFGTSSTPAFGSTPSPFGSGTSTFGQKPTTNFGSFGSTPAQPNAGQANPFGSTSFGQSQPAFGSSTFGSNAPAFGSSTPAFGSTSFGASSTPSFGTTPTPAFGATSTPAFGASSTPAFGATSSSIFGSSSTTNAFGQSTSAFGSSSTPAFGSTSVFGSTGATTFGAQSSPGFGSSPSFGATTFGGQKNGSRAAAYAPTTDAEAGVSGQAGKLMSISAMPAFKAKTFEELRFEDYQAGDKGGPNPQAQQPASGIFGQTPATTTPFGATSSPAFSQTPASSPNPFSSNTSSLFGAKPTTTFGAPGTASGMTPSPFGAASSTPAFGQSASTPVFGQASTPAFGQASTPAFGQASTPAFGQASTPAFGQASTPAFGQASTPSFGVNLSTTFGAASTPSSFASGFGSSPSMFGASSTPAFSSASSSLFSAGTSTFGSNPFSQSAPSSSLFSTPSQPATVTTPAFNTPNLGSNLFGTSASPFQTNKPAGLSIPGSSVFGAPSSAPIAGFGFSNLGQSQPGMNSFGAPAISGSGLSSFTPQTTTPVSITNPFGNLPPMPQMSIGPSASPGPSIQYGISSMPATEKPTPMRMTSVLTPRHITQRSRIRMQARGYNSRKDTPKTSFFSDGEDTVNISKGDALFVPRENPRALVIRQPGQPQNLVHSTKSTNADFRMEKDDKLDGNGTNGNGLFEAHSRGYVNSTFGRTKAEEEISISKGSPKQNGTHLKGIPRGNGYASVSGHRAEEAAVAYEHGADIEAVMPKLRNSDYFIQPKTQELAAKERAEPGYCRSVNEFVIGRHGYGFLKFLCEVDVRGLDLENIVQFNKCEVLVYMDESKRPPPGSGLNKPAEITLLNVKCVDKKSGQYLTEGVEVEKFERRLKKKTEEQGADFISYNAIKGEWKFRVKHFSKYYLEEEELEC